MDPRFEALLADQPLDRLILEVTEHSRIDDYTVLLPTLDKLRARGLQLAVDDAGAGCSTFRHIIQLSPDIIKLDMSLTRDIDTNPARRALASALIVFARDTSAKMVARGHRDAGRAGGAPRSGRHAWAGLSARPATDATQSLRPSARRSSNWWKGRTRGAPSRPSRPTEPRMNGRSDRVRPCGGDTASLHRPPPVRTSTAPPNGTI